MSMPSPMPSRESSATPEGRAAAVPRVSAEQFRLHLLERIPDAARSKFQGASSVETAAGNGLRELWEKSDLTAGKFADEVASFWRIPRLSLQDLMGLVPIVEQFSARFLRESSVFPFRAGESGLGLAVSDPSDGAA